VPDFFAYSWKAALLYQPGDAALPSYGGFSKKTPVVEAFEPNALVILEARLNPVEAPISITFSTSSICPFWLNKINVI
jgi:hypothetical protein